MWATTNAELYPKYMLLTKLLHYSFICTAMVNVMQRTFWTWNWSCFIWNIRFELNSYHWQIYFEKSNYYVRFKLTFYLFIIPAGLSGKPITVTFIFSCCFLIFLTYLLFSSNQSFLAFITFLAGPLEMAGRGLTAHNELTNLVLASGNQH